MLIICNGAFKSGSSWLHAILIEILNIKKIPLSKIPDPYTNDINSPTKIIESKLFDFISCESFEDKNYITKSHFFKISTLSEPYSKHVKFIFIERSLKDAIVSHFYHIKNKFQINISFNLYYLLLGKYKAYEIYLFNHRCKKYFGKNRFVFYHDLKNKFSYSINKICKILEIDDLNDDEIKNLMQLTKIEKLRERSRNRELNYYPSNTQDSWKQFRKGNEGEWMNYFSNKQLIHVNNIESGSAVLSIKLMYFFFFTLRRYLVNIE